MNHSRLLVFESFFSLLWIKYSRYVGNKKALKFVDSRAFSMCLFDDFKNVFSGNLLPPNRCFRTLTHYDLSVSKVTLSTCAVWGNMSSG